MLLHDETDKNKIVHLYHIFCVRVANAQLGELPILRKIGGTDKKPS